MSSYKSSYDKYTALSFGLDHHMPAKTDPNLIYTEFECYSQNILQKLKTCHMIRTANLKPTTECL